jgi:exopolysaccharide biosynthesis WecB/TagA/CpsF family protein
MDVISPPAIKLLDMAFSPMAADAVVATLLARPPAAPFAYVVTPNADHLQRLAKQPELRTLYEDAAWRLLDSRFLYHLAGRLGCAAPPVVTGADLTAALLAHLNGVRVAVIGMTPRHFALLQSRYPGVVFLHHAAPPGMRERPAAFAAAAAFAVQAQAAFTFIALGSPLQERLAHVIARGGAACGVGLCIGSALDFAAGAKNRAPLWMRRAGLEWAHRLAQEPRRLARRYWRDLGIIRRLVKERKTFFF